MCEIRFSINQKDGKLEKMINKIPSTIRTEVTKEALRYFLNAVRDNKIESNYIDSSVLQEFKTDIKDNLLTLDDMFRILDSRAVAQAVVTTTTTTNTNATSVTPVLQTESVVTDCIENNEEVSLEENLEDEFLLDLTNSTDSEDSDSITISEEEFENMPSF